METLVSVGLVSLVALPLVGLTLATARLRRQADIQEAVILAARTQLDALRLCTFSNLTPSKESSFPIPPEVAAGFPDLAVSGSYRVASTASPDLKQISVEVRWRSQAAGRGGSQLSRVRLTTLVANP